MKFLLVFIMMACCFCSPSQKQKSKEKNNTTKIEKINVESPFNFYHDPKLVGTKDIVVFGETKLDNMALFNNDQALKDLTTRYNAQLMVTAYKIMSTQIPETMSATQKLVFPESFKVDNFEQLLSRSGVEPSPQIEVVFNGEKDITLGGKAYNEATLAQQSLPLAQIRNGLFTLQMKRIEDRVSRTVVGQKAQEQKVSIAEFLEKEGASNAKVSDQEARQYGLDNNVPESRIDDKMLERLRQIVASKRGNDNVIQLAAKLLGDTKIMVALKKPGLELDLSQANIQAPKQGQGPLQIFLFSNFLCEECRNLDNQLHDAMRNFKQKISLNYVFNFKDEDRLNRLVSEAALCVHNIDKDKFWDFKDQAIADDFDASETKINAIVKDIGISDEAFKKCLLSRQTKDTIASHLGFGSNIGQAERPMVLVQGKVFAVTTGFDGLANFISDTAATLPLKDKAKKKGGIWAWIKGLFS